MIYYLIRLKMKIIYYTTRNYTKYNKLNHVSNKYKEEFGKPLLCKRVILIIQTPVAYVIGYFVIRKKRSEVCRKYKRYNRIFKEIWLDGWHSRDTDMDKFFIPNQTIDVY